MLGACRCLLNMFVVELTAGDVFSVSCFLLARSCWAALLLICVIFGICSHFSDDLLCFPLTILLVYLDFQSMGHTVSGFIARAFKPSSSEILSAVWPHQWSWLTTHGLSLCLLASSRWIRPGGLRIRRKRPKDSPWPLLRYSHPISYWWVSNPTIYQLAYLPTTTFALTDYRQ